MLKKLTVAAGICLGLLLFSYSVAAAWHATVTGVSACDNGQRSIAWSVTNSENTAGTFTYTATGGIPAGSGVLKANKGTTVFSTNVAATGTYIITVTPSWPNNNEHPKAYASVNVSGTCITPTTTTRPVTTTRPPQETTTTRPPTTTVPPTSLPPSTTTLPPVTTTTLPSSTTTAPSPTTTVPPTSSQPSTTTQTTHEQLAATGLTPFAKVLFLLGLILFCFGVTLVVVAGNKESDPR